MSMQRKSEITSKGYPAARLEMVQTQLANRDITAHSVLGAFKRVPRHLFVPEEDRSQAYEDHPLPIGCGQTISQPYVVAYMLQKISMCSEHRVLEIGTGSGYLTALLAEIAARVFTVEFVPELADKARETLDSLGYQNVEYRIGDGTQGWAHNAPFDGIIASASANRVPTQLTSQLAPGARMIIPVGDLQQHLVMVHKGDEQAEATTLLPVRFVQMQSY